MDYQALAKQFGGAVAQPKQIDYAALAAQSGGAVLGEQPVKTPGGTLYKGQYYDESGIPLDGPVTPSPRALKPGLGQQLAAGAEAAFLGAVNMPGAMIGGAMEPIGALMSGKYGTQEGVKAGEALAGKVTSALTVPMSPLAQEYTQEFMEATGPLTGLQPELAALARTVPQGAQVARTMRQAPKAAKRSAEGYIRGGAIDAAADARRMGLSIPPSEINPSPVVRGQELIARPYLDQRMSAANEAAVRNVVLKDLGLPETTALHTQEGVPSAFDVARSKIAEPYNAVRKIPIVKADAGVMSAIESVRPSKSLIGKEASTKKVYKLVDSAIKKINEGLTGSELLDNVRQLRADAKRLYDSPSSKPAQIDLADANMAIANQLERLIEANVSDATLLARFRDARQNMAKSYAYESATNRNTGIVDATKIAELTKKDSALTGDLAALGRVAGNFPEAFQPTRAGVAPIPAVNRSGPGGAVGSMAGAGAGLTGSIAGGLAGSASTLVGGRLLARRLANPEYQAGLRLYDPRIVNTLADTAPTAVQNQLALGYDPRLNELAQVTRTRGPNEPNFVFAQPRPEVTPAMPEQINALPAPNAQATINALRAEDARRAAMSRTLGQQAEAQAAAAEAAAPRRAAGRGVELELDPVTGQLRPVGQAGAALPETPSIRTAADKVASGQRFAMTAPEKVMWEKTKVNLGEIVPGMRALTDEAIAARMGDRAWVEQTVAAARAKAEGLARQEALVADALANRANLAAMGRERTAELARLEKIRADRQNMLDLAEELETQLSRPRATSKGRGQGPKTLAAKRNQLMGNTEVLNNLRGE